MARQWRNVLFDLYVFELGLIILCFFENLFELFFCKKKYLLVGVPDMLWTGGSVDQSNVRQCLLLLVIF